MSQLQTLRDIGAITALDLHFARMLGRRAGVEDERVLVAAALACHAPARGDVCCDLEQVRAQIERDLASAEEGAPHRSDEVPPLWKPGPWRAALAAAPAVVSEGGAADGVPLVLDGDAVYLDRFRRHEDRLVAVVRDRACRPRDDVDVALLRGDLAALFDVGKKEQQRGLLAAATAVLRGFTVIHGGPGTGKTTVVARLLALLNRQAAGGAPRVTLVAPTGKAQARLTEAIRRSIKDHLPAAYQEGIPTLASTIHRCLKWTPRTGKFSYNADNTLPADVVIVDEASMVDLPLMARLFAAVPNEARLILLGDPDQLVSVEAGAVLGDICKAGGGPRSASMARALSRVGVELPPHEVADSEEPSLADCLVKLDHSWRFEDVPHIGDLAKAINADRPKEVLRILDEAEQYPEVTRLELGERDRRDALAREIGKQVVAGYRPVMEATDPAEALAALRTFRVLCAHRRGRLGAEAVNRAIELWLANAKLIKPVDDDPWYLHRPVMVTRNDNRLKLFNGDVGIVLPDADDPTRRRVYFDSTDSDDPAPRSFLPGAIPEHETVFATTVHKAQGSEYDDVLVILPEKVSPIVTRELLYTAVTRAKKRADVLVTAEVIEYGVKEVVVRSSRLRARLG